MHSSLAVVGLLCSGCIAATARVHVGVVGDGGGFGAQAGLDLGIGIATKRGAVTETGGVVVGRPEVGMAVGLDYERLPEPGTELAMAWRAGIAGVPVAHGVPVYSALRGASLYVLRDRSSDGSQRDKEWFRTSSRSVFAVGLEAMVGVMYGAPGDGGSIGGGAGITAEWTLLNRVD